VAAPPNRRPVRLEWNTWEGLAMASESLVPTRPRGSRPTAPRIVDRFDALTMGRCGISSRKIRK
jgi:hypothetical protein